MATRKEKAARVEGLRLKPKVAYKRIVRNQSSRHGVKPRLIVLHSTESHNRKGLSDLQAVANWFDNPDADASSHVILDKDGVSARCVYDSEKAWTVSNWNPFTLNIEQIGWASQGRTAWKLARKELRETARWIAHWSLKHDIPIRKARNGETRGVCTHAYAVQHGAGGSHWDPGDYPLGFVLWLAKGFKAARIIARRR